MEILDTLGVRKTLRICHITTLHEGNDVRIFHKECCSLVEAGYEVFLLVVNEVSRIDDGVNIVGVEVSFSNRWERFIKGSKVLYNEALKIDADIFHFHDPEFLPFANKLIKRGRKVVYDVHEDVPRQILSKYWIPGLFRKSIAKLFEWYENYAAKRMTAIVCATDKITDRFFRFNSNAIAVKNYPILKEWDDRCAVKREENTICYVGSITKVRGIVELINAIAGTEIRLHLVGDFSPLTLEDEVKKLAGWKNVVYHGVLDRMGVREIMQKSKIGMVTLHPIINYLDALPVKMFEYMACGLPVLASDIPLWKEIIEGANCGAVVDPMDHYKIRSGIASLINDHRLEEFGTNGKNAVFDLYNWHCESIKLKMIYEKIKEVI